jgi:tRNA(fMet)-specific endonuclease VapC
LPYDQAAALAYGRIIAQRGWVKGKDYDHMIAAHAISTRSILVTINAADFIDVPGLALQDWTT